MLSIQKMLSFFLTKAVQIEKKETQNVLIVGDHMSPAAEAVLPTRIKPSDNMWSEVKFLMPLS